MWKTNQLKFTRLYNVGQFGVRPGSRVPVTDRASNRLGQLTGGSGGVVPQLFLVARMRKPGVTMSDPNTGVAAEFSDWLTPDLGVNKNGWFSIGFQCVSVGFWWSCIDAWPKCGVIVGSKFGVTPSCGVTNNF